MRHYILLFFLLTCFGYSFSQTTVSGFYVTNANDTVSAQIKLPKSIFGSVDLSKFLLKVEVVDSISGEKKFKPEDIAGFGFLFNEEHYRFFSKPAITENNLRFLQPVILGQKTSLYQFQTVDQNGAPLGTFYTFEKADGTYTFLITGIKNLNNLNYWQHSDGRELTWKNDSGVLETVSEFWNNGKNREDGIGGSIETKQKFGDLQFHMEFRYPVEAGKTGQDRGNSGLFFFDIGEIQILNSYALTGYWDDCGSIYKQTPAMVNAAGPPLQWQTYDVELLLPKFDNSGKKISNALLTVWLNGILIHSKLEIVTDANKVSIGLQDHINCLQYRNIWLKEL